MATGAISTWRTVTEGSAPFVVKTKLEEGRCLLFTAAKTKSGEIEGELFRVFTHAVGGNGHLDFVQGSEPCHGSSLLNTRGNLAECSCEGLNRLKDGALRRGYEDQVILRVLERVEAKGTDFFGFHLVFIHPGRLLDTEILLFRLINELAKRGVQGKLQLTMIDESYGALVGKEAKDTQGEEAFKQLLGEVSSILPDNLELEGSIYEKIEEYVEKAQGNERLKYDLLVAPDTNEAVQSIPQLTSAKKEESFPPVILFKTSFQKQSDVFDIGEKQLAPYYLQQVQKPEKNDRWNWMMTATAAGVAAIAIVMIHMARRTSSDT